jgi:ribosome-binding factor A
MIAVMVLTNELLFDQRFCKTLYVTVSFKQSNFTSKLGHMQEGKRQKQVGGLLHKELSDIFQRIGLSMVGGSMISISSVKITPDLLEARIYFSVFQAKDPAAILKKVEDRSFEIKKELAARVGKQLRRMPELKFFLDDTLDHVFKMEEIFKQINNPDNPQKSE